MRVFAEKKPVAYRIITVWVHGLDANSFDASQISDNTGVENILQSDPSGVWYGTPDFFKCYRWHYIHHTRGIRRIILFRITSVGHKTEINFQLLSSAVSSASGCHWCLSRNPSHATLEEYRTLDCGLNESTFTNSNANDHRTIFTGSGVYHSG